MTSRHCLRWEQIGMTCSPSQIVVRDRARPARERIRTRLTALLARLGRTGPTADVGPCRADDALATALMDAYAK